MSNWVRLNPKHYLNLDQVLRIEVEDGPALRLHFDGSEYVVRGDEAKKLLEVMAFEAADLAEMRPPER